MADKKEPEEMTEEKETGWVFITGQCFEKGGYKIEKKKKGDVSLRVAQSTEIYSRCVTTKV